MQQKEIKHMKIIGKLKRK